MRLTLALAAAATAACTLPAAAGIQITQGMTAPTYGTTLNFDEPGTPTGTVPTDTWADLGLVEMQAGDLNPYVDDFTASQPWIGTGNSFFGNFGVFMTFDGDLTEMSFDVWDPSGPPSPFGGGLGVFVLNDGVEVASFFTEPAWGGLGDPAFDITTTDGDVFDEVRVLGFGFFPTTYMDDISWNAAATELVLPLDIKPGSCPNSFNRGSHGVLPVALLGTMDVDVTMVDLDSLLLVRADGVGGAVAPNDGPPGPSPSYDDVAGPFEGVECECSETDPDGLVDLVLHFRTDDTVAALELGDLPSGALVPLSLQGMLTDGTPFSASDCVRLVPPGAEPTGVTVSATLPEAWIDVSPLDCTLDGGGYASFSRCYPETTQVTLTAPASQSGRRFVGWAIDGAAGLVTSTELTLDLNQAAAVTAVYGKVPTLRPAADPRTSVDSATGLGTSTP